MNALTLERLKNSIRHWHRLATGTRGDCEAIGPQDCALCSLFYYQHSRCAGCPVLQHTGETGCAKTPWTKAAQFFLEQGHDGAGFRVAANLELEFLVRLLPSAEERVAMETELSAVSAVCGGCGLREMTERLYVQAQGIVCAACA